MSKENATDKALAQKRAQQIIQQQEEAEALKKVEELKNIDTKGMNPYKRFSLLKQELRYILLSKDQSGYNARYFYVSLAAMQKVIVELENKYDLTSVYTEKYNQTTGRHEATRTLYNTRPDEKHSVLNMLETKIDITNLKEIVDPFGLETGVLKLLENEKLPKDTINSVWLGFLDPKEIGAISTYMQRYTYNQLYDFQETSDDAIEVRAGQKDKVLEARKLAEEQIKARKEVEEKAGEKKATTKKKKEETEVEEPAVEEPAVEETEVEDTTGTKTKRKPTQEEIRKADKTIELRAAIKKDFTKELVMGELKEVGKSMNDMTEEELINLIEVLNKKKIEEESK